LVGSVTSITGILKTAFTNGLGEKASDRCCTGTGGWRKRQCYPLTSLQPTDIFYIGEKEPRVRH
jgi:hypothetical protein